MFAVLSGNNWEPRVDSRAEIMTGDGAEVLRITGEATELARVRRWARHLLADIDEQVLIDVLSVVDELTSNALRHGKPPYEICLRRAEAVLRVEVADGSTEPATPRSPDREGGRGLQLIAAYALGWGEERRPDGKTVWAELDLSPTPPDGTPKRRAGAAWG
jgi:two-component sensor histidine kinase